jgi:hypothetical protein
LKLAAGHRPKGAILKARQAYGAHGVFNPVTVLMGYRPEQTPPPPKAQADQLANGHWKIAIHTMILRQIGDLVRL